jgi:hypothetical protein
MLKSRWISVCSLEKYDDSDHAGNPPDWHEGSGKELHDGGDRIGRLDDETMVL